MTLTASQPLIPIITDSEQRTCQWLAASDLVPSSYKGKPENVLAAAVHGRALGIGLMQAMQSISVINGKPGLYGDAALALVLRHPECDDVIEDFTSSNGDDRGWTCTVKRRGRSPVTRSFTVGDAKLAKLWQKRGKNDSDTPWITYPDRMLQMRARSFALRDAFADALAGFELAEVVQDLPPEPREVEGEVMPAETQTSTEATRSDQVLDSLEKEYEPTGSENDAPAAAEGVSEDIDSDVDKPVSVAELADHPSAEVQEEALDTLETMPIDQAVDLILKRIEACETLDELREMQSDAFTVKHRCEGNVKASVTRAYNNRSKELADDQS